jgi:hypothetical protein
MTVVVCWRLLRFQSPKKAVRCHQMIDFVDHLSWDLIHNQKNAKLEMVLVELSSLCKSSSSPPALVLISPTSIEESVVSCLSNDSGSILLPLFTAKVKGTSW